jgi:hypothetical protein
MDYRLLRKFIHHPVVLASVDQDYFRRPARDVGPSGGDEYDRETIAPVMSKAALDLEGPVRRIRKKLLQLVGALRAADTIAEQDHPGFQVSHLPSVQEMVGGGQGKHVTGVRGIFLLGWMAVRSRPERDRRQEETHC